MAEFLDFPDGYNIHASQESGGDKVSEPENNDLRTWFLNTVLAAEEEFLDLDFEFMEERVALAIPNNQEWHTNTRWESSNRFVMYYATLQERGYDITFVPSYLGPEEYRNESYLSVYISPEIRDACAALTNKEVTSYPPNMMLHDATEGAFYSGFTFIADNTAGFQTGEDIPPSDLPTSKWMSHFGVEMVNRAFMTSVVVTSYPVEKMSDSTARIYKTLHDKGFRPFSFEALHGLAESTVDFALNTLEQKATAKSEES